MSYKKPKPVPSLQSIIPDEPLLLMGAGPVPIPASVAAANSVVINHVGRTMSRVTDGVQELSRYVFQTASEKVIGVAGPASGAMEMAIANLLWEGRSALVVDIGTFSSRWVDIAERTGADVTGVQGKGINPPVLTDIEKAYESQGSFDVFIATHGETSSGVMMTELAEIARFAKSRGSLVIVDAVTTVGLLPVLMDEWQIDVLVAGGQKGLGSIPGVSLLVFSDEAWEVIETRKTPPPQWCYDAKLAWGFWGNHAYHYTAPVPGILALYAALQIINDETLESRWERHALSSSALQKAFEGMGLELFAPEAVRLPSVIAIKTPPGVGGDKIRHYMADTFGVEISGSFGHDIIRVGQMSEQCRSHNLFKTVYALGKSCEYYGVEVDIAKAMGILEENLTLDPETFVT